MSEDPRVFGRCEICGIAEPRRLRQWDSATHTCHACRTDRDLTGLKVLARIADALEHLERIATRWEERETGRDS